MQAQFQLNFHALGVERTANQTVIAAEAQTFFFLRSAEQLDGGQRRRGFEQVGLSLGVFSDDQIDRRVKAQVSPFIITKIFQRQRADQASGLLVG